MSIALNDQLNFPVYYPQEAEEGRRLFEELFDIYDVLLEDRLPQEWMEQTLDSRVEYRNRIDFAWLKNDDKKIDKEEFRKIFQLKWRHDGTNRYDIVLLKELIYRVREFLRRTWDAAEAVLEDIFSRMDISGDGIIDQPEFEVYFGQASKKFIFVDICQGGNRFNKEQWKDYFIIKYSGRYNKPHIDVCYDEQMKRHKHCVTNCPDFVALLDTIKKSGNEYVNERNALMIDLKKEYEKRRDEWEEWKEKRWENEIPPRDEMMEKQKEIAVMEIVKRIDCLNNIGCY